MRSKSEHKKKLEQQRLFLMHQIQKINKHQDEQMLRNILLDIRKEELVLKGELLEKIIKQLNHELSVPRQTLGGKFNTFLYMN